MVIRRLKVSASFLAISAVLLLWGEAGWGALFNQAPVISQLNAAKKLVAPLEKVALRCVAVDRDRDSLKYEWSAEGGKFEGSGPAVAWKAPEKPGVYTITVTVNDGKGGRTESQMSLQVLSKTGDNPPLIEDLSARPKVVFKGESTTLVCDAMDPDGDALTYHWEAKAGRLVGEGGRVVWFAPLEEASFAITCTVTDGKGNRSRPATVTVTAICDCEGRGRSQE